MIVILKNGAAEEKKNQLIDWLKEQGLQIHTSVGEYQTVLGLVGDTSRVDMDLIASLGIVDSVKRVTEPFKCCNRKFHPDDTVVQVGDVRIGGGNFVMIAGPCSVESEEQIVGIAKAVKASGAQILRGGAFKPRTSPYDFQGLAATGLELLKIARQETGLPIVTEIMGTSALDLAAVPMLHELTHLPVIVDPSHSTGLARMVRPMALAAAACGTDGLIIEVHNDPMHALCDGAQSIKPEEYDALCRDVRTIREVAMR